MSGMRTLLTILKAHYNLGEVMKFLHYYHFKNIVASMFLEKL
jgi:hypothetical protein